ncbi:MAG: VIT1/CCC1 transporter family protein [Anaerolineales bacterium]|nr:VIT1/CCC1 transporter family protein [Anaerolineales bacterium]
MEKKLLKQVLAFQRDEITNQRLYDRLANMIQDEHNAEVMREMAKTELEHYRFWRDLSKIEVAPNKFLISFVIWLTRILGLTFTIKLIERGEKAGAEEYAAFEKYIPGAAKLGLEEEEHEQAMMNMLHEDFLSFMGSIVLGLNDALVELTGTLAGLTLALQNGKLVAVSGLITGIAAAFSMASSEYLSARAEGNKQAKKSALYTGAAYLITVFFLIAPYLLLPQTGSWIFVSLVITLFIAVVIIYAFNFYISVAKDLPFSKRFFEMFTISMGVAAFSFLIGLLVRSVFGIEV